MCHAPRRLLALPGSVADQAREGRARALYGAATLAGAQGDYAQAVTRARECLALYRKLQDDTGMIGALNVLANVEQLQGHSQQAMRLREEHITLCRAQGDRTGLLVGLHNLGHLAQGLGEYARVAALFEECLALQRADGATFLLAGTLSSLGSVMHMLGDLERAGSLAEEGLALARELGDRCWTAFALKVLGGVVGAQRDHARAHTLLDEGVDLYRQLDNRSGLAAALCAAGKAAWRAGDTAQAAGLYGESLVLSRLDVAPPAPPDLGIRLVVDAAGFAVFLRVSETPSVFLPSLAAGLDPAVALLVGYVEGRAVASARLVCLGPIAEITGIVTVPSAQRRSYGTALTWAAIAAGRQRGCKAATLTASAMGYPVYLRMGFRPVGLFRTYLLPEPTGSTA
jgi:tetratricopeptide (TPR) repeat protein